MRVPRSIRAALLTPEPGFASRETVAPPAGALLDFLAARLHPCREAPRQDRDISTDGEMEESL